MGDGVLWFLVCLLILFALVGGIAISPLVFLLLVIAVVIIAVNHSGGRL